MQTLTSTPTTTSIPRRAIAAALDGVACSNFRARYSRFDSFADEATRCAQVAVDAGYGDDTTMSTMAAILDAARASRGPMALRAGYAAHLAQHHDDNPLER